MNSVSKSFLRAMESAGLQQLISRMLLIGLLFMGDGFALLYLSSRIGGLYCVALSAFISLTGALIVGSSFRRHSKIAVQTISAGEYPKREYVQLSGLFISLVLVTIPGLFTAAIGAVLYLPPFRRIAGSIIHHIFTDEFRDMYNFRRIAED